MKQIVSTTTKIFKNLTTTYGFWSFIGLWFLAGLLQNYYTSVSGEEAYYWLFSQDLAWGYLDHPPMVGFFTALGFALFKNALGVRLGMLLLSVATILVIRALFSTKDNRLFIMLLLGFIPVHAGAMLVKTDVPLLFFEALFFLGYKQYLKRDGWKEITLIAVAVAGIVLSKHHGFLIVIFTVLSNPSLFVKRSFWAVVGVALVMLSPHIIWQFTHDFATVKFHLYNRIDMGFSWSGIAYYLLIQPLVFGPLIGLPLFIAFFKYRQKDAFTRALQFTVIGVLVFFLISTFKVEFHKHWTSVLAIPLLVIGFEFFKNKPLWKRWVTTLSIITVVLLIPARLYLMVDFLPPKITKGWDVLHNWDRWAAKVQAQSAGLPVVFNNHYERASRYAYLTQTQVHCYNTFNYRETQHDLWDLETKLQGQTVFQINRRQDSTRFNTIETPIGEVFHYRTLTNFRSYRFLKINAPTLERKQDVPLVDTLPLDLVLTHKGKHTVKFLEAAPRNVFLTAHFLQGQKVISSTRLLPLRGELNPGDIRTFSVAVPLPEMQNYQLRFSVEVDGITPPINSIKYSFKTP